MAIVGDAYVVVRALTDKVESDIRRGFSGVDGVGRKAGESMGKAFTQGFNKNSGSSNVFTRFSEGISAAIPKAEQARAAWAKLNRATFALGPAISLVVGGLSSLVGGLGALVGVAGGASASLVIIGNGFAAVRLGALAAKLALGGVGKALSALNNTSGSSSVVDNTNAIAAAERALSLVVENNRDALVDANNAVTDAQLELNAALKAGREEIQQIGFEAEDAALAEQQAAIDLDKAREALARTQDLPPNSRARKEAELAYQEAELNLRKAKDKSADLNKEQDRLAKAGVAGTSVVVAATKRLAEAEAAKAKTIRNALRDQISAEEALAEAKDTSASAGGGSDPYAGLNAAQIQFVKNLQSLKPLLDELKLSISNAFLPPLWAAISLLADKAFPTIKEGMTQVAGAMGSAAISLAESITETENLADLQTVFSSSARLIEGLGRVLGNVWDAAVSILAAASPLAERFVKFLENKSQALADFLDTKQATGELTAFFDRAGDLMSKVGDIFGNLFSGFGKIISANFGRGSGGEYLLDWLVKATDKFANLDKTAGGSNKLSEYFSGAAVNLQKILSSVGSLISEFIKLGDHPAIGEAFDVLAQGAPVVGEIARKFVEAAPAAAELLNNIVEIFNKFTDTAPIKVYFDIITSAISGLNDLLSNELVANVVGFIAVISSVGLAFGSIFRVGKFAFEGIAGAIGLASGVFGKFIKTIDSGVDTVGDISGKGGIAGKLGGLVSFLGGPWGIALVAAGAAWSALMNEFEKGIPSTDKITTYIQQAESSMASLKIAASRSSTEKFFWGDYAAELSNLSGLLGSVSGNAVWDWLNLTTAQKGAVDSISRYGEGLAQIASTNLPQAQSAFRGLVSEQNLSKEEQIKLLNEMPAYKDALYAQAEALGMNVTSGSEAEQQQKLLELAMGTGEAAAYNQKSAIDSLAEAIVGYTNTAIASTNSEIAFQSAIDNNAASIQKAREEYLAANGTMDGFKMSLDLGDEAGRRNTKMLTDLAGSTTRLYQDTLDQTGSQEEANKKLEEGRQALYDQAIQMGATADEAQALTDKYLSTPKTVDTEAVLDAEQAKRERDALIEDKRVSVTFDAKKGVGLSAIVSKIKAGDWLGAITTNLWANGGVVDYFANGGLRAYANGGLNSGIYKGRPGGLYKFAEPETGWEAFISGKSGQEKRNISIWEEAGRRLGVITDNYNGGLYAQSTSNLTAGGKFMKTDINITVNPAPGMNEQDLAAAISREISFQMRKGAVA